MKARHGVSMSFSILRLIIGLFLLNAVGFCFGHVIPPLRGVYSPGFNATNSGVMPEPGLNSRQLLSGLFF